MKLISLPDREFGCAFCLQPAVSGAPKKQKNAKLGNDDITLPLMEKNQGQHYPWALSSSFQNARP